jgi:fibronectin-binding autotransporter adhesin
VVIAAGATLDVNGRTDTIGDLSVSGTVTAGNLSIGSLTLNGSGSIAANLVLGGNVTKSGSVATVLPGTIDLGGSIRTFDVAQGTAPELTLSNVISNGGLSKVGPGELRLGSANTYTGGTSVEGGVVRALVARAIPTGALTISSGATADLGGFAHSFTNLNGAGTLLLGGATLPLNVTGNAAFDGVIEGAGALIKQGSGSLTLGGANSFETLTVEAGRVNLTNGSAAGTGLLTVNSGATVQFGATLSNNVNVTSGTIASQFGGSITNGELTVSGNSQANTFNLTSNAGSELILAGSATLRGGGNLNVTTSPAQANADTGPGFRLRGTVASDYSGTITMQQRTKFEVQVDNAESPNPFGTGKLVMVGGTSTGGLNGTYSQFQARILTGGVTYQFANDVELSGAGYVNANMLGGADVRAQFRSLRIGDGQILGASKNDQSTRTLAFSTVTLTGGMAEFRAYDPAFAVQTNATRGGANIVLGAINESVGGSGIVFKAAEPHFNRIEGTAAYTGPTRVEAGTLQVGASGSLASSSSVFLDSTAKLDVTEHASGYTVPAAQLLTGPGDWDGRIVLSGTLAPGEGIGTMTGDDFTLNGGSLLKFQLSTADNQADLLEVTSFTKGSAGAFRFDFDGTGRTSGVYTLVRFGSTNFSAADFTITNLAPGLSGNIELSASELRLVLIPEPASALSLVLGAGTLLSMRRRRRP